MTLGGAPDYQSQSAGPLTLVATLNYAASGGQSDDISSLILPHHTALFLLWTPQAPTANSPIVVTITMGAQPTFLTQATLLAASSYTLVAVPGRYITDTAGTALNIVMATSALGSNPVTGQLLVFGVAQFPLTIPTIKATQYGVGSTTGNVGVATGTNVVILDNPPVGTYYRIKFIQGVFTGVPTLNSASPFVRQNTADTVIQQRSTGTQNERYAESFDWESDQGIIFQNTSGVTFTAHILYERWQR